MTDLIPRNNCSSKSIGTLLILLTVMSCTSEKPAEPRVLVPFEIRPTSGSTTTVFEFDASKYGASDSTSAFQVSWDFEGENSWTPYEFNKISTHQYLTPGEKHVIMHVKAAGGLTLVGEKIVNVTSAGWQKGHGIPPENGFGPDLFEMPTAGIQFGEDLIVAANFDSEFGGRVGNLPLKGGQLVRWNGSRWLPFTDDFTYEGIIRSMCVKGESLIVVGSFSVTSSGFENIAVYSNGNWQSVGQANFDDSIKTAIVYHGEIIVGGDFTAIQADSTVVVNHTAVFRNGNWIAIGQGFDSTVAVFAEYKGELYAGGSFTLSDSATVKYLSRFDTLLNTWVSVNNNYVDGQVDDMTVWDGKLVVVGSLFFAPGIGIGYWDGRSWSKPNTGVYFPSKVTSNGNNLCLYVDGTIPNVFMIGPSGDLAVAPALIYDDQEAMVTFLTCWQKSIVVGGDIELAGSIPSSDIAFWVD